jgi:AraC-like DNA-binding protein
MIYREDQSSCVKEDLSAQIRVVAIKRSPYAALNLDQVNDNWIVSFVQSGQVVTGSGGRTYDAPAGSVMIHPPGVRFTERAETPGFHLWVQFDAYLLPHRSILDEIPLGAVIPIRSVGRFEQAFLALEKADGPSETLVFFFAFLAELTQAWREAGSPKWPEPPEREDRLGSVLAFMTDRLNQPIQRQDIANFLSLHPGYLDRIFTRRFGIPPMRMLREMRVRRAAHLLRTTNMTLDAIAEQCGFPDAGSLARSFRPQMRTSPGRYRESAKLPEVGYLDALSPAPPSD